MPGLYRQIDKRMYGDAKFRALSRPQPNGQTLWTYLLTGEHTTALPGLAVAGEAMLAEALGWSVEGFREAFGEVFREGLAKADWRARVVWVPNAIKYNPPASPNVVRSWGKLFDVIPECDLKAEAEARLKAFVEGMGEGFAKAFREAFAEDFPESGTGTGTGTRRGDTETSQRRATPPPQGAVPPPAASQGEGEAAQPEPPASAGAPRASRRQLEMLGELASEKRLTLVEAAAKAGVQLPLTSRDVTTLKDWLKTYRPPPPRPVHRGSTIPDEPWQEPTPEEREEVARLCAEARENLERMARAPDSDSAGSAADAIPPPPEVSP